MGLRHLARIPSNKQLVPVELVAPGGYGINTEQSGSLLPPIWATDTLNCVIDTNGRLAARQGTTSATSVPLATTTATITNITQSGQAVVTVSTVSVTNPFYVGQQVTFSGVVGMTQINGLTGTVVGVGGVSGAWTVTVTISTLSFSAYISGGTLSGGIFFQSLFEANFGAVLGYQNIAAWPGGITNNFAAPLAGNISGAVNTTNGRWFFQNFNNKVIGFQPGQVPIVYTGVGTFNYIVPSSGVIPTGGIGCTAFGRVWTVQADLQTIQYSALLDETNWGTTDAGVIDMHTVWSAGTDQVTAIFAFNSSLIICGLKHIVVYTDGRGSLIGIDPTQMYVGDILTGTGCISQFTVQPIGQSDVLFCSPVGVQSLARLISGVNNPLITTTKYIRSVLLAQIQEEIPINISSTYDPLQGFYLLALPLSGNVWCLDLRKPFQDDAGDQCLRCTYWLMAAYALMTTHLPITYISNLPGQISFYSGASDGGALFSFRWQSPWLLMDPQISERLKMLKRYTAILITAGGQAVSFSWNIDFNAVSAGNESVTLASAGIAAQYGIGQYGISEYGGGQFTTITRVDVRGRGQYYQLILSTVVNGVMALQQVQAAFKIGRIA